MGEGKRWTCFSRSDTSLHDSKLALINSNDCGRSYGGSGKHLAGPLALLAVTDPCSFRQSTSIQTNATSVEKSMEVAGDQEIVPQVSFNYLPSLSDLDSIHFSPSLRSIDFPSSQTNSSITSSTSPTPSIPLRPAHYRNTFFPFTSPESTVESPSRNRSTSSYSSTSLLLRPL